MDKIVGIRIIRTFTTIRIQTLVSTSLIRKIRHIHRELGKLSVFFAKGPINCIHPTLSDSQGCGGEALPLQCKLL